MEVDNLWHIAFKPTGSYNNWEGGSPDGNAGDKDCATLKSGAGTWEVAKSCTGDSLYYLCEIREGNNSFRWLKACKKCFMLWILIHFDDLKHVKSVLFCEYQVI